MVDEARQFVQRWTRVQRGERVVGDERPPAVGEDDVGGEYPHLLEGRITVEAIF